MMRATTLEGRNTWFGPNTIKCQGPSVVKMIGLKTTINGGLMPPEAEFAVESNLLGGGRTYTWPSNGSDLHKCRKVASF